MQLILFSSDLNNYSIQLSPELINLLSNVIKLHPEYFNSTQKTISEILISGKIDIMNVPDIIVLLKELYQILYNLNIKDIKKGINVSSCESIIKFVVNVILVNEITDPIQRTELLNSINSIIGLGIDLITVRKVLKNSQSSLFSCISTK